MATAKDCHTLTSYYEKLFKEKYGASPNINRYSARWGFDSMLGGMSMAQAKELLEYYFITPATRRHSLDWFFYNYEKVTTAMLDSRSDEAHRRKLMEESRKRAEKWRKSGKQSVSDD